MQTVVDTFTNVPNTYAQGLQVSEPEGIYTGRVTVEFSVSSLSQQSMLL